MRFGVTYRYAIPNESISENISIDHARTILTFELPDLNESPYNTVNKIHVHIRHFLFDVISSFGSL